MSCGEGSLSLPPRWLQAAPWAHWVVWLHASEGHEVRVPLDLHPERRRLGQSAHHRSLDQTLSPKGPCTPTCTPCTATTCSCLHAASGLCPWLKWDSVCLRSQLLLGSLKKKCLKKKLRTLLASPHQGSGLGSHQLAQHFYFQTQPGTTGPLPGPQLCCRCCGWAGRLQGHAGRWAGGGRPRLQAGRGLLGPLASALTPEATDFPP